jgi:hypothetical protein
MAAEAHSVGIPFEQILALEKGLTHSWAIRSIEDYDAMRQNPAPLPYFEEALTLAKFESGTYEVVETYSASS